MGRGSEGGSGSGGDRREVLEGRGRIGKSGLRGVGDHVLWRVRGKYGEKGLGKINRRKRR